MASNNYRVYLDGNQINDFPKGLDELNLKIIRESGFGDSEQILRDDTDIQLMFWGDGLKYICDKRKFNYCEEILCTITVECDNKEMILYEGFIMQTKIEVLLQKCIGKVLKLKDNSFSALMRNYISTEINLSDIRTLNCNEIEIPVRILNTPTTPNTYTITDVSIFDVLDVFKYLVAYFTDNRVEVKSDFLSNNSSRYAITTGYNLHNTDNNTKAYPKISIEKLLTELRKKLTLYMAVEYESDGTPFLRIEPEDYFYSDEQLLEIPEMPLDAIEKIDSTRLFNDIQIGSNSTQLQDNAETLPTMPQQWIDGWNKDTKVNCGGCSGEKGSSLDLVSDFIIDGNLIHEAMNEDEGSDYANDDAIYLLHYNYVGVPAIYPRLVGNNTSTYNIALNNENTLKRWVGISNKCIKTAEEKRFAFFIDETLIDEEPIDLNVLFIEGTNGYKCGSTRMYYVNTTPTLIYDNSNSLHTASTPPPTLVTPGCPENINQPKYFECQKDDVYRFKAKIDAMRCELDPGQTQHPYNMTSELHILVFSDNTFTTLLNDFHVSKFEADGITPVNLEIETPEIDLQIGNTVFVYVKASTEIIYEFDDFNVLWDYTSFELLPSKCTVILDETDKFKPFITVFQYPLCLDDYLKIKYNKRGYVLLNGQKAWIKELDYEPDKLSTLTLIHKETFCKCKSGGTE